MQTYSLDKNINLPQPVCDALASLNDANFFSDGLPPVRLTSVCRFPEAESALSKKVCNA